MELPYCAWTWSTDSPFQSLVLCTRAHALPALPPQIPQESGSTKSLANKNPQACQACLFDYQLTSHIRNQPAASNPSRTLPRAGPRCLIQPHLGRCTKILRSRNRSWSPPRQHRDIVCLVELMCPPRYLVLLTLTSHLANTAIERPREGRVCTRSLGWARIHLIGLPFCARITIPHPFILIVTVQCPNYRN